mmetsp:Transcript_22630/g.21802  ORF Transcript_22630/g.21802 Transcript_22630/m.21802 type:complete len:238 (+) Transcript_22630:183-896(+)
MCALRHHFIEVPLIDIILFLLFLVLHLHFEEIVGGEVQLHLNGFIGRVVDLHILHGLGPNLHQFKVQDVVLRRRHNLRLRQVRLHRQLDVLQDVGLDGDVGGDLCLAETPQLLPALLLLPPQLQVIGVQWLLHHVVLVVGAEVGLEVEEVGVDLATEQALQVLLRQLRGRHLRVQILNADEWVLEDQVELVVLFGGVEGDQGQLRLVLGHDHAAHLLRLDPLILAVYSLDVDGDIEG